MISTNETVAVMSGETISAGGTTWPPDRNCFIALSHQSTNTGLVFPILKVSMTIFTQKEKE